MSAYLRGDRPLASMKSAKQVAGSRGRALCASRVSASPVSGTRPVVHRLLCTSLLPATASQLVSAALDRDNPLIDARFVSEVAARPPTKLMGELEPEFQRPLRHSLKRDIDAALCKLVFDVRWLSGIR